MAEDLYIDHALFIANVGLPSSIVLGQSRKRWRALVTFSFFLLLQILSIPQWFSECIKQKKESVTAAVFSGHMAASGSED